MRARPLVILASATALAVGGALLVSLGERKPTPAAAIGQRLFPDLAGRAAEIASVSIAKRDGTLTFHLKDGKWLVAEKGDYPVDFAKVRKLVAELADLRLNEAKTATPALHAELEVEELSAPNAASTLVTLKDARGNALAATFVGKQRPGRGTGSAGDMVFVRRPGEAQSWQAQGRVSLERETQGWLDVAIMDIPRERVASARVIQADGGAVVARRDSVEETDFALADPPEGRKPKPAAEISMLGGTLETLQLEDVRTAAQVDFAGGTRGEVRTFDGLVVETRTVERDGVVWVGFSARFEAPAQAVGAEQVVAGLKPADEVAKEAADIQARIGGWAYRVLPWKTEILRRKLDDVLLAREG
jgi:hypothetical protein